MFVVVAFTRMFRILCDRYIFRVDSRIQSIDDSNFLNVAISNFVELWIEIRIAKLRFTHCEFMFKVIRGCIISLERTSRARIPSEPRDVRSSDNKSYQQ